MQFRDSNCPQEWGAALVFDGPLSFEDRKIFFEQSTIVYSALLRWLMRGYQLQSNRGGS